MVDAEFTEVGDGVPKGVRDVRYCISNLSGRNVRISFSVTIIYKNYFLLNLSLTSLHLTITTKTL